MYVRDKLLLVMLLFAAIMIAGCSPRDEIDMGGSHDNVEDGWEEFDKYEIAKFARMMDSTYPSLENRNLKVKAGRIEGSNFIAVYMVSSTWCGSGSCTLFFAKKIDGHYKEIGMIAGAQLPIRRIDANINGFPAIGVWGAGIGQSSSYEKVIVYDGKKFVDSNRKKNDEGFSEKKAVNIIDDSERYIVAYE